MKIKSIEVNNFKTFDKLSINLQNLNFFIGQNASGKSNFINIFRFLKFIEEYGLKNAISLMGGDKYFRNVSGKDNLFSLKINFELKEGRFNFQKDSLAKIDYEDFIYEFVLDIVDNKIQIIRDTLSIKCKYASLPKKDVMEILDKRKSKSKNDSSDIKEIMDRFKKNKNNRKITIEVINNKVEGNNCEKNITVNISGTNQLKETDLLPSFTPACFEPSNGTLLLELPYFRMFTGFSSKIFDKVAIFDFNPKISKNESRIVAKTTLEEDGNNLPIVLKSIIEKPNKKKQFLNILKDILPFATDITIENRAYDLISFNIKEKYNNENFPSQFLSDGTINLTAIIVALFFEKKDIIVLEEPERFIHPSLVLKVMNLISDAAKKKQIFITTHNAQFLRYAQAKNIFLVKRNNNGYSEINKLSKNKKLEKFLANDLGLDDLFLSNLL